MEYLLAQVAASRQGRLLTVISIRKKGRHYKQQDRFVFEAGSGMDRSCRYR